MNPFDEGSEENAALAANVKHYGTSIPANNERYDEDVVEEVAEEMEKNFSEYTAKEFSVWHCCGAQGTVLEHHERKNEEMYRNSETFDAKTEELFSFLQILTASVGGFAHGANDVSNAIAPLVVIVSVYLRGDVDQEDATPWWILLAGGVGISLGLAMWGYRVMSTIGTNMTKLTPSRGFNIEFGASMTVLIASRLKIPTSTTHCVVGSVFAVGLADGIKAVNWRLLLNVVLSWVVTLPATGLISAAAFAALRAMRTP
jgi:phosphate/sulfate permease